jgi:DNA-binding NarL/FixJ family response regulator
VRRLRSTIATVADVGSGLTSIVGAVRDVTDEVRADHKIAAHVAVSNALEEWTSLDQGARRLLRDLAEALEFHAGSLWLPVRDRLVAGAFWAAPSLDASDFESATWSLGPPRGVCLPGKTWKVAEPINLANVHKHREYARSAAATRAGLRGAVAFPALHADEVLAVVELHSREEANLSGRLMRSLRAIGYELGQFFAHRRVDLHPISLTPRQLEILRLAAQGCTGRQIAERLFISPTTVKSHFEHIYAKFGVGDRASALVAAMRYGFIE